MGLSEYIFTNNQLLLIGAYIMIAVGGFLFLVGFCGCCGAQKKSKCLLIIYIVFCAISFLVALAAGIVEAVYQNQMDTLITDSFVSLQQKEFDALYNSTNGISQMWYLVMQNVSSPLNSRVQPFPLSLSKVAATSPSSKSTCPER